MASLPIMEYNDYKFSPAYIDPNPNKYQILAIKPGRYDFTRNNEAETLTLAPNSRFPLGWDPAILNLYRVAYVVSSVARILAALTIGGGFLFFSNWILLGALIVAAISSRCIHYLEWQKENKSFEIAAKIVCTVEQRARLFYRSEYGLS